MSLLTPQRPSAGAHTDSAAAFVPDQSRAERTTSYAVADFPVPTGREEEWRFTPVDRLHSLIGAGAETIGGSEIAWESELPAGVTLTEITTERARELGAPAPADRAAVVAVAGAGGAMHLDIPAEAELSEPVRITVRGGGAQPAFGHLVVTAGRFSKATVVVQHTGTAQFSEVLSTIVGDGANLTVVPVQEWTDDSLHLGQHDVVVGRDATVRHIAVTLGGGIVRLNANATYAGPGGSFEGLGVYFADAGQHQEHRLFVDHEAPHCRSNVEYKGALQGETARTVWVGDVLIRAAAEGTDTYELNRNLILTDGARADSVPNLEIETGEIEGAGHASATGRFDDQQLFYLQARGIDEDTARRLVVRGFFASVVGRIGVPEIEEHLMAAIDRELEGQPVEPLEVTA
ncbi:Fe-S cluster assembly protein SufD [Knoellia remsis]|uniref:Fe-S cluster assembly protein SufD n=1 Tax=Knoellia remsis TaxID=407159 RepID=A0A2T0UUR7_9MICO|nr:Fe-S cluster assembly protein SufD [Knoellia remsis]PRY61587.1 Fe-S cluster assembly protein SufD [Knoellia remsis]